MRVFVTGATGTVGRRLVPLLLGAAHAVTAVARSRDKRATLATLDAERSAARFDAAGGVGVVVRFAGFYGPDAFQVHDLARAVRRGFATIPGPPEAFLSSISHDDAATACLAALSVSSGVYNVADDEPLTHRAYVDTVAAALGVPSPRLPPRWAGRLMGSIGELLSRSQRIFNAKLRRASGWSPRYPSAREGWLATVAQLRTALALGRVASAHRAG